MKHITKKTFVNQKQECELLSERLAAELEDRNELESCNNGYCSLWYVTT